MTKIKRLNKSDWPKLLKHIPDPPIELFIKGPKPNLETIWLCIIGSRKHTPYGKQVCEKIIPSLKRYNIGIVSGLAFGIDTLVHKIALENNIPIIAVPGSGLDDSVLYPRSNINFSNEIIKSGGCLISEFNPKQKAAAWLFPKRNRIMAGISQGVLIIESRKKSGTQITARLALDYNREVMAVPGSIFSNLSEGPNFLLSCGAVPVTKTEDILDVFNIPYQKTEIISIENLPENEKEIMIEVSRSPISKDDLCIKLNKPLYEINSALTMLELKDLIVEIKGLICQK